MLCLIKGWAGFVSLAGMSRTYRGSTGIEQCIIIHLPALNINHILPDIILYNIQQLVMFLVETILLLHVEGF
jgi:protein-arginine kinase